ncbi:MAG TPA: class I SAM-dependent methyltransferase [Thermomicrobiales bacterium]|nr:class I SAM-dependent methyltransferase [Thermomicrobiales bacterium]
MSTSESEILREQQEYYNARAAEYDEWWMRVGRYDRGAEENSIWFAEQEEVRSAFDTLDWGGEILELAGGTGIWTEWLASRARHITVLDGSLEMIAINSVRLEAGGYRGKADYHQVNLFDWQPERQYDGLFMGYFISHVPTAMMDSFLATVASALKPGGVIGLLDGRRETRSTSSDQPPPGPESDLTMRRLNDGRRFQIVKRFDEPAPLTAALARQGIDADVRTTAIHFLYATGHKQ